jgi:CHAT domain-containing protein
MAERVPDYDELRLRIELGPGERSYRALAFGPGQSSASTEFQLPFDQTQLENFILRVARTRRGVRSFRSPQMQQAKAFGGELFDAVFRDDVRELYVAARRSAEEHERGLRVTLSLSGAPELMEIPWELLYARPSFLAQSIDTPVVRSLDLGSVRPPRPLALPLRVLGMISSPRGFEPLDVDRERAKLEAALGTLVEDGSVELRWLQRATLGELDQALASGEDLHVFHYVGHGAYDESTEGGVLVLEDDHNGAHEVTGSDLGVLLHDVRSLRLAVLNACEGARSSHVDPFSGVASGLVEHGIPAVIGMQFEITDDAAIIFADRFYKMVARSFPVDAALAQARKAIWAAASHDVEWATPVLFLRAADARIFDPEPATAGALPDRRQQARLSLELQPTSAEPAVGETVSRQLKITNTGVHQLAALRAKDPDGRMLADPVDLAPGQSTIARWRDAVHAEHDLVITVTATEPAGSQLTEQITAHLPARARTGALGEGEHDRVSRPTPTLQEEPRTSMRAEPAESAVPGAAGSMSEAVARADVSPAGADATASSRALSPRRRLGRKGLAALLALVLLAAAIAAAALLSSGSNRSSNEAQTVSRIGEILVYSKHGRDLRVEGDFDGAISNRKETLRRVRALQRHANPLAGVLRLLEKAAQTQLKAVRAYKACGGSNCAQSETQTSFRAKVQFVDKFNPLAQRYLHRTWSAMQF